MTTGRPLDWAYTAHGCSDDFPKPVPPRFRLEGPNPLLSPEDRVLTNAVERYLESRGERATDKRDEYGRPVWTCGCAAGGASSWAVPCARHRWAIEGRPDEGVVIYGRRKAA